MTAASTKYVKPLLLTVIVITTQSVCAKQVSSDRSQLGRSRVAPPVTLACDRNQLTAYIGEVTEYHRTESSVVVTISTDWDTIEKVAVDIPESEESVSPFLINGQPFSESDWNKVESQPGSPISGLRAFAWVCLDEQTPPVIDWRPQR